MKAKISVSELTLGMYVTELDRPWLETPFLFQGFRLTDDGDLQTLRELCQYVYIEQEEAPAPPPPEETPISARIEADERKAREIFHQEIPVAREIRGQTRDYMDQLAEDIRLGNALQSGDTRNLVRSMMQTITVSTDASIWLTHLKRAHDQVAIHSINTCVLAIAFANFLQLRDEQVEAIGIGALLHDIGKIKVPREILDKPGPLTDEEHKIVRRHSQEGYNVLKVTGRLPDAALDAILHHHERLDGRGYPDGLKGEDFSLGARIVQIADVYDELSQDRVYHEGLPPHDALRLMRKEAADHFGAELMEQFIKCIGIYPMGSVVKLNTGALGVVVSNSRRHRLQPVLMMLRDAEGKEYRHRPIISLAAMAVRDSGPKWHIVQAVDPRKHRIDMTAVAESYIEG